MSDYEKCERAYKLGATPEKLRVWVLAGKITEAEFNKITNPEDSTPEVNNPDLEGYYSEEELAAAYQEGVDSIG